MLLKLIFVSVLILKARNATAVQEGDQNSSFSVEKIWKSYQKPSSTCGQDEYEEWNEGIQELYDGCKEASQNFVGPSFDMADKALDGLQALLTKLIYFTTTNSTVLAPNSNSMLEAISRCRKCDRSGLNVIKEFNKVQLSVMSDLEDVSDNLEDYIGDLTCSFNDALSDLGYTFSSYMRRFLLSGLTNYKTKVDYEPTLKKLQKLMNLTALISDTMLNKCENPTPEVQEAVTILNAICAYYEICVQGVQACVLDTLYRQNCEVSERQTKCSMSLDYVVGAVTQSIVSIVTPLSETIEMALKNIVNITKAFNRMVKNILGVFEDVTITVENILENLTKGGTGATRTQGLGILKGLNLK